MNKYFGNSDDDLAKNFIGQIYKTRSQIRKQKEENELGKKRDAKFVEKPIDKDDLNKLKLMVLAIISLVGVEAAKVIMRKNFGLGSIGFLRLIICCLCFFFVGLISLVITVTSLGNFLNQADKDLFIDGPFSYLINGIFYIALAVYSFKKGKHEIKLSANNNVPYGYQGDSDLLSFLKKEGWSEPLIRGIAEPVLLILTGLAFTLCVNVLGGLPLIACGLSLLAYAIIRFIFPHNDIDKIRRGNAEANPTESFSDVNS